MDRGGRPGAGLGIARAFENAEYLQDSHTAGTGGRRGDQVVAPIPAGERLAFDHLISPQVGERDEAAVLGHGLGQPPGGFSFVELARAGAGDAPEGAGELGLHEPLAGRVEGALLEEDAAGVGKKLEFGAGVFQTVREVPGNGEAFRGQLDRRGQQFGPGLAAVVGRGELEAAHGAGDADGAVSAHALARQGAVRAEVHVAAGRCGRALAEIEEGGASIGEADQHESPAADVARRGMRDRQREPDRDGRIDGVAAGSQHCEAGLGGMNFARHHHGVVRTRRLTGRGRLPASEREQERNQRQGPTHLERLYLGRASRLPVAGWRVAGRST